MSGLIRNSERETTIMEGNTRGISILHDGDTSRQHTSGSHVWFQWDSRIQILLQYITIIYVKAEKEVSRSFLSNVSKPGTSFEI